ncbi:DsbC family protein [Vibrio owensii]|uniref:DsbC family protein n=1 Tax=Vibrio owensii TaxID=696485 RepID=UPI003CC55FF8
MKKLSLLTLCIAAVLPTMATAATVKGHVDEKIVGNLMPGMDVVLTHKDQASGLNMVRLASSEIFFTNDEASFIIGGQSIGMFTPDSNGIKDVSTPVNETFNKKIVDELVGDTGILLKAENEEFVVTAFVDPACGYCQKMHSEIDSYLDAGISIRFAAFPIFGDKSKAALESVMSEKEPTKAVEALLESEQLIKRSDNFDEFYDKLNTASDEGKGVVAKHTEAAKMLGMRGTPGLVLKSGKVIPSYIPASDLKAYLKQQEQAAEPQSQSAK